jgi:hypothetical protein
VASVTLHVLTCIRRVSSCSFPPSDGAQGRDSDVVDLFGYVQLSRRTLIFSTLGLCAGFLVLIGCCYQAVTFQGENEELPGPNDETELAKEQKEAGLTSSKKSGKSSRSAKKHGTGSGKARAHGHV